MLIIKQLYFQYFRSLMGGEQSKQAQQQQGNQNNQSGQQNNSMTITNNSSYYQDEQFFVVQQVDKVKLQGNANDMVFLWIDPRIYNDQNGKNLKTFKQKLTIEEFSSITSLQNQLNQIDTNHVVVVITAASLPDQNYKYMNSQRRISQIILFCQNQQRANLLMSNFSKIRNVGYSAKQVIQKITQLQQKYPSRGLVKNSVLFMTQDDAAVMNKYRLNYFCLTNQRNRKKAKTDFEDLARKLCPQQKQIITQFSTTYSLDLSKQERRKQTSQWIFKDSFYWNLVQNLPKVTTDPRKLAYLRLPIKDIYETILVGYRQKKKKPDTLYIVVELSENQKQKLQENQQNFLTFTTFLKGYTDQKKANQAFKKRGSNAFKFDVKIARNLHEDLDFGFIIMDDDKTKPEPNVVFNLYNFFKITELTFKARRGTLQYGSLALMFKLRQQPSTRIKLKEQQKVLLRNYDYLEDLMKKIKNQGNVLQLSGYFKQSLQIYDKKLEQITRTNKPAAMLDQYRIQKADTLKSCQQYDLAEKQYLKVQTQKLKLVAKVRLIQLYFIRRNQAKLQQTIEQVQSQIYNLKNWGFTEDYFRAKNYKGLNLMKKQKFKEAKNFYRQLRGQISDFYDYKFEGIPLVHEIYRNLALSQTRLNNHDQALSILNSTKSWQQNSEGKGPTLILTQKLIQSVCMSKGDQNKLEESQQNMKRMLIDQSAVDINFIDASRGAVKMQLEIQQSLVNIDLSNNTTAQTPKKEINIQQSTINIDF